MQFREIQIAKLSGVPLIIDYTWPPIALLHVGLLAFFYPPFEMNALSPLPRWQLVLSALLMTTLLFVSIIIHELAHAGAAKLEGIETIEIRLHLYGGWAKLASEPKNPLAEFPW